ncbi:GAP family protein [Agrococcus casei]|uniref:GAP family protein n=1 Tax=Agrococcus casei TaxID=343512 RepID=UPI003F91BCE4
MLITFVDSIVPEGVDSVWMLVPVLAVLALIDSTSFGTLLIPIWLLMTPGRLRGGRVLLYLAVVATAYAVVGLVLLSLALLVGDQVFGWLEAAQQNPVFLFAQVALGVGMLLYSFRLDPWGEAGKERKRARDAALAAEGKGAGERLRRMRERAVGEGSHGGLWPLLTLGLVAVGLEIASLLPYLAGIGLVAAEDPGIPLAPGLIVFYCLVMIAPALLLLAGRLFGGRLLDGLLRRIESFLTRHASGTIAWIIGLLGILLAINAYGQLQSIGVL